MAHAEDHGYSTANWAGVVIELLAAALICCGLVTGPFWLVYAGIVLIPVGFVAWRLLIAAGLGDPKHHGPLISEEREPGAAHDIALTGEGR